jgi:hypothetical protein
VDIQEKSGEMISEQCGWLMVIAGFRKEEYYLIRFQHMQDKVVVLFIIKKIITIM